MRLTCQGANSLIGTSPLSPVSSPIARRSDTTHHTLSTQQPHLSACCTTSKRVLYLVCHSRAVFCATRAGALRPPPPRATDREPPGTAFHRELSTLSTPRARPAHQLPIHRCVALEKRSGDSISRRPARSSDGGGACVGVATAAVFAATALTLAPSL
jgi:hypothetical protein